jgi:hypothetical protein
MIKNRKVVVGKLSDKLEGIAIGGSELCIWWCLRDLGRPSEQEAFYVGSYRHLVVSYTQFFNVPSIFATSLKQGAAHRMCGSTAEHSRESEEII